MKKSPAFQIDRGFKDFARASFGSGGDNLYVNAKGLVETIHRTDINNDGYVDLVLPNSHGYIERGPTWIYAQADNETKWLRKELPNDSGWMSRVIDVDGDGYNDLIVVNAENGVTSELTSYIYWGGPHGLTGERTEFKTAGAYDVAVGDVSGNGLMDVIFPSAWVDHHNPGRPRPIQIFEQIAPRQFVEVSEHYGLSGSAAVSIICEDLNGDGRPELVVANYRTEFEYDTESLLYWGTPQGFNAESPLRLPTHHAMQVTAGDLSGNGWKDLVFAGGNRIYIYWNDRGKFSRDGVTILNAEGVSTMFCIGAIRVEIADVDGDGRNELIVATVGGVEIRTQDDLKRVKSFLPIEYCTGVTVIDLDGDGRPEIIASKYQDGHFYDSSSAVFWNGPNGFAAENVTYFETSGAMGCTAGDLDGDGKPEIIFNNTMRSWSQFNPDFPLYVYLGNADHEYSEKRRREFPTGGSVYTYAIADTDLDGFPELIIPTMQGVRIFPGGDDGPVPDRYIDVPYNKPCFSILVADLNRDGWLDLICHTATTDCKPETLANASVIFWGGPEGYSAERSSNLPIYSSSMSLFTADVNKDGWLDMIYGDKRGFVGILFGGPEGFSQDRMARIPLKGQAEPMVSAINVADINGDGWLDIIISVMGHYARTQSGFYILYGGPEGFSGDRTEFHATEASSLLISVADINNDGHLDLLVPAYSTQFRRELPAFIYWGNGKGFDFEHPFVMQCEASCAFLAIDITGNGYRDVLAICHRNDLGHQVDSLLYWNGPEGLSADRVTRLPGLGPHLASPRDFGNAYTREPVEFFISAAKSIKGMAPSFIAWDADTPGNTSLMFQLRWARTEQELSFAPWCGPDGEGSFFERTGQAIPVIASESNWIQYKAFFVSPNGCHSPKLREVRLGHGENGAGISPEPSAIEGAR